VQLHQDFKKKGVVVIGLSDETDSKVATHIKGDKTPYIVASGSRSGKAYGIPGYPTFYVINPEGKVTYKGHGVGEARKAVEQCLKDTPPKNQEEMAKEFDKEAVEKLKKADELYKKKMLKDALDAYKAVASDYEDTPSGKKAKQMADKIKIELSDVEAAAALKKADGLFAKKKYQLAIEAYEKVAADFPKTASAKKAEAKVEEIKADKTIAKEMREAEAAKKCKGWIQMARGLAKNGKVEEARRYYEKVIEQYGDTSWAATAKEELAKL